MLRTFAVYSLSNFQKCNTVLLTIVTTLYIEILPMTYLFYNCKYLFIFFAHLVHPPPPPLATNLFSVSMSLFSLSFFVLRFHK